MSIESHLPITGNICPQDDLDEYATHLSEFGNGDKYLDTIALRDVISTERRSWGMRSTINSDGLNNGVYILRKGLVDNDIDNNANWQRILNEDFQVVPGVIIEQELRNVVFCEQFLGDTVQTTFQLNGTLTNASFASGSWSDTLIQASLPSYANKPAGGKIYKTVILGVGTGEIKVLSISPTGLVTLNNPPRAENFIICYWYKIIPSDDLGDSYVRADITTTMEADAVNVDTKINILQARTSFVKSGSRNTNINIDVDMRREDGTVYNNSPYIVTSDKELKYISAASSSSDTWEAHVLKNGVSVASVSISANTKGNSPLLSIPFVAGDEVRLRAQNITGNVSKPSINAEFRDV